MLIDIVHADPEPISQLGFRAMIESTEFRIVESCRSVAATRSAASRRPEAMLVCEAVLSDGTVLDLLCEPGTRPAGRAVVIYSRFVQGSAAAELKRRGACVCVSKAAQPAELLAALRAVPIFRKASSRKKTQPTGVTARTAPAWSPETPLTQREWDVLTMICGGLKNQHVADALGIGRETVKEHVEHILAKLHVADRTQAALWAHRRGWLPQKDPALPPLA